MLEHGSQSCKLKSGLFRLEKKRREERTPYRCLHGVRARCVALRARGQRDRLQLRVGVLQLRIQRLQLRQLQAQAHCSMQAWFIH